MKRRILSVVAVLVLLAAALPASIAGAQPEMPPLPLPVDIDARLKNEKLRRSRRSITPTLPRFTASRSPGPRTRS